MAMNASQSRTRAAAELGTARRFCIPFFPTLLGALAALNVASVVLALIEF